MDASLLSISSYFFEAGSLRELGLELPQLGLQPGSPSTLVFWPCWSWGYQLMWDPLLCEGVGI